MIGNNPDTGHHPHCVVRGGNWFAARMDGEGAYCLVGCTVTPGFEFADLELAKANELSAKFPAHADLIRSLCRH